MNVTELLEAALHLTDTDRQWLLRSLRPRRHPGPQAKRDRVTPRWLAVERILAEKGLPPKRRGLWSEVLRRLINRHGLEAALTRAIPRGATISTVAALWIHVNTLSAKGLRDGFHAWQRRQRAAKALIDNFSTKTVDLPLAALHPRKSSA
jgi:hypothetical protein